MKRQLDAIRDDFHTLNNWLSKITVISGLTKEKLETKGFDLEKLEDEKRHFIKLLNDMEYYALKIGDILKDLRKSVERFGNGVK